MRNVMVNSGLGLGLDRSADDTPVGRGPPSGTILRTRSGAAQPLTTSRLRGASFSTIGPSSPQTTMSSMRAPNRPSR